jgi:hypothetical protein
MALRKIIEFEGNAFIRTPLGTVENGKQRVSFSAYIKVASIAGNKNQVNASIHFSSEVAQFTKEYQVPVSVQDGSPNFIEQVYKYLKTLPEFSGAEDC